MNRDAIRRINVLSIALALALVGCGQSPTINPTPTNTQTGGTPTSTPTASGQDAALALYYVGDTAQGFRLYREFHRLKVSGSTPLETALTELLSGAKPLDPDYRNLWPSGSRLLSVSKTGDTATIDLSFPSLNVGSEGELRAIDQLVWTATAADTSVARVRFLRDGKSVESFAGHVDTTTTFKRQPTYEVLAPVWITSVEEGDSVKTPLTFGGLAQVFEANVQWQVLRDKKVLAQGSTLATEAAPARAPWKVTVTNLQAGTYTLRAFASSAKDGSLVAEDTKTIQLK